MLKLLILVQLNPIVLVKANLRKSCDRMEMPVVLLEKSSSYGNTEIRVIQRWDANAEEDELFFEKNNLTGQFRHRYLIQDDDKFEFDQSMIFENMNKSYSLTSQSHHSLSIGDFRLLQVSDISADNGNIIQAHYLARECNCFGAIGTFCPFATTLCSLKMKENGFQDSLALVNAECIVEASDLKNTRIVLFLACITFILWFCYLCLSHKGHSCMSYIPARLIPAWNPAFARFFERHRPKFARRLVRQHVTEYQRYLIRLRVQQDIRAAYFSNQNQAENNDENVAELDVDDEQESRVRPTSLILRTTIYRSSTSDRKKIYEDSPSKIDDSAGSSDTESEQENSCSICLGSLVDGERVGALHCNHTFHVDCLKDWLLKRNVCPLCQAEEVATPRFGDPDDPKE